MEELEIIVKLTLAKLEIVKLKHTNGGYDWSMVDKEGKELINKALSDIDGILNHLNKTK